MPRLMQIVTHVVGVLSKIKCRLEVVAFCRGELCKVETFALVFVGWF
jgi:hypothetical protein